MLLARLFGVILTISTAPEVSGLGGIAVTSHGIQRINAVSAESIQLVSAGAATVIAVAV